MTTLWDALPLIISLSALAVLIWLMSLGSGVIEQWYADHRAATTAQEEHQRSIARWTKVLAICTAIVAGAGVGAAYLALRTLNAIRGQLDEMQADRRPWVQGAVEFAGPLAFNDNLGATLPIRLSERNSGRSPAMNVQHRVKMYPGDPTGDIVLSWESELCKGHAHDTIGGFTMFPSERPSGGATPIIIGVIPNDVAKDLNPDGEIILRVIMCIDYTFPTSGNHHQTSYIWELDKKTTDGGFVHIRPSDKVIQPNELILLTDPSLPGRAT